MQHFIELFLTNHVKQLTVAREMEGMIHRYFPPLYRYTLAELTPLIIEGWVHTIGDHSHAQANKSLSILRTMVEKARDWRLFTGDNPAARVKKYPKHARTRFVQPAEMPALMAALRREREDVQCFFLLCLLVGCRRSEALTLRWVDLSGGLWHKPTTKTGLPHTVPIPESLWGRLEALPRVNQWVFATQKGHWCKTLAFEYWQTIRRGAGLTDVTIHDLRRSCCSWLACNGTNLAVIGRGVLNHTSLVNVGIYARLNVDPVRTALEANSRRMLG